MGNNTAPFIGLLFFYKWKSQSVCTINFKCRSHKLYVKLDNALSYPWACMHSEYNVAEYHFSYVLPLVH